MTKKSRRTLFYSFIVIFLVLSILIVFVAFGYGYDFAHNRLVKTGALGIKSNVGAHVFLNSKEQGQTSFFNNSFSKGHLIPGEYNLKLESDNYQGWEKKVQVEGGVYTDFSSIFLIPKNLKIQ